MSVTWVLNGTDYEISSKDHLLQLMSRGTLYTDAGNFPTSYWTSDYIQTVDIDLESDASISPIGISITEYFSGKYDGALFSISNWTYTTAIDYCGLFGYVRNATLQGIRLAGVWTLNGFGIYAGFLAGVTRSTNVYNIEGNFDSGSSLYGGLNLKSGGIIGFSRSATCEGITIRGNVLFDDAGAGYRGGIIGESIDSNFTFMRNLATFPNGIFGQDATVGGIVGYCHLDKRIEYVLIAMTGDIVGQRAGGYGGYCSWKSPTTSHTIVNSMKGNISANSGATSHAGGFFGNLRALGGSIAITGLMNYMTGNITTSSTTTDLGGIAGYINNWLTYTVSITNSIVAMNGNVLNAFTGLDAMTDVPLVAEALIDDSFGMTYTTLDNGSISQVLTGYTIESEISDLPYFPLEGSVVGPYTYKWDMIFGNVGGKASYSEYTHIIIFKGDMNSPVYVDFDVLASNTIAYVGYYTSGNYLYVNNASLVVNDSDAVRIFEIPGGTLLFGTAIPTTLSSDKSSPFSFEVNWTAVANAEFYRLTYEDVSDGEVGVVTDHILTTQFVNNLSPSTGYTMKVYAKMIEGSEYTFQNQFVSYTTANEVQYYPNLINEVTDSSSGVIDLSALNETNRLLMDPFLDEAFVDGSKIKLNLEVDGTNSDFITTLVHAGSSITDTTSTSAILTTFNDDDLNQSLDMYSESAGTQTLSYDNATKTISFMGTTYNIGDKIKIDGRYIVLYDI